MAEYRKGYFQSEREQGLALAGLLLDYLEERRRLVILKYMAFHSDADKTIQRDLSWTKDNLDRLGELLKQTEYAQWIKD